MRDTNHNLHNYKTTSTTDLVDQLRLIRSDGLGPMTYHKLIEQFGTATKALEALPELIKRGRVKSKFRIPSRQQAEDELEHLHKLGGVILSIDDPAYPALLRHIEGAPPLLSVLGNPELLNAKSIGMVGARNASSNGQRLATSISRDLGKAGLVTVSGLARGIDTAVHHGSIETGTIAVLGCGVDIIYPKENANLYSEITEKGVLVSEIPLSHGPQARYFPARNRIISGMSSGVVVIEAAMRSGSLITARYALEQGRDVFAVPGSPQDSRSKGSNNLLRQGAVVTESARDVLDNLCASAFTENPPPTTHTSLFAHEEEFQKEEFLPTHENTEPEKPVSHIKSDHLQSDIQQSVRHLIGVEPTPVDRIIRDSDLTADHVSLILTEMEIAGQIERLPGNCISLTRL